MKLKHLKRIVDILILIILATCIIPLSSKAMNVSDKIYINDETLKIASDKTISGFDDWQQQAKNFIEKGNSGLKINTTEAINAFLPIGRILVGIATIVLVVVGLIFGVKYMIAGANDKAQLKQKLIYYVISVVLVYGAVGIFSIVISVMNNLLG